MGVKNVVDNVAIMILGYFSDISESNLSTSFIIFDLKNNLSKNLYRHLGQWLSLEWWQQIFFSRVNNRSKQ